MIGATILCITPYLKEKKVDGLYTELWFLGIIFFALSFGYFSIRPKFSIDESTLYFNKLNKVLLLLFLFFIFFTTFFVS